MRESKVSSVRSLQDCRRTVAIFENLLDRRIVLHKGNTVGTEGTFIRILDNENRYTITEYLLSYFVANTDLAKRHSLITLYRSVVVTDNHDLVGKFVGAIADILERRRALSLWKFIYPGSASKILAWQQERTLTAKSGLIHDFNAYELELSDGGKHKDLFDKAFKLVECAESYDATIFATKTLIKDLTIAYSEFKSDLTPEQNKKADAARLLREGAKLFRGDLINNGAHLVETKVKRNEVTKLLKKPHLKIKYVDKLEFKNSSLDLSADVSSIEGEGGDTYRVVHHRSQPAPNSPLTREERERVRRLRRHLSKVTRRRGACLEEAGLDLDTQVLIQNRIAKKYDPCFRSRRRTRGFKITVLLDHSSSLKAYVKELESTGRVLNAALNLPFVDIEIVGFTSRAAGQLDLIGYSNGRFDSVGNKIRGVTPLHLAMRYGINNIDHDALGKYLLVLTDGYPVFSDCKGLAVANSRIMQTIYHDIKLAKETNVSLFGFAIGSFSKDFFTQVFNDKWVIVDQGELGSEVEDFITDKFVKFVHENS